VTPAEHYHESEYCLARAERSLELNEPDWATRWERRAQVHATPATVHPTLAASLHDVTQDLR
jgi:hypothetical protein